jgi:hypothetical protein
MFGCAEASPASNNPKIDTKSALFFITSLLLIQLWPRLCLLGDTPNGDIFLSFGKRFGLKIATNIPHWLPGMRHKLAGAAVGCLEKQLGKS